MTENIVICLKDNTELICLHTSDNGKKTVIRTDVSSNNLKIIDGEDGKKVVEVYFSNKIIMSSEFKNHKKDGKTMIYNPIDYYLFEEIEFKDDKENGKCTQYFKDGSIKSIIYFKDGKRNGKCTIYYSGGIIKEICNYIGNKEHGLCQMYNKKGKKIESIMYFCGNIINITNFK